MRLVLLFLFCFTTLCDQPVATYSRFCASCGIWGADTIVSQSGQFIVHGPTGPKFSPTRRPNDTTFLLELEPQLVAVTAERTKRTFLEDLAVPDQFQDKIHMIILNRAQPEQPIGIVSQIHSDGFQYQIGFPMYLEPQRFIKGLVQGLLQEYANRGSHRTPDLPSWLVEGMTRQLLTSPLTAAVLNREPLTVERRGLDRLGTTRSFFQTNSPMTIQELSFSNLSQLSAAERDRFENSAQLLVNELLQMKGGPALMSRFLQSLSHTLNWQTAFFNTYQHQFQTPLDLEKWWMMSWLGVKQHQSKEAWGTATSMDHLESLLRTHAELRGETNTIPQQQALSLQEIIRSTEFQMQKEILGQKLQQLFFLSVNLSPDVTPLANAYQQAIDSYLQRRSLNSVQPTLKSDPEQRLQTVVQSTIKTLDQLDRACQDVRDGRQPVLPKTPSPSKIGRQPIILPNTAKAQTSRGNSRR